MFDRWNSRKCRPSEVEQNHFSSLIWDQRSDSTTFYLYFLVYFHFLRSNCFSIFHLPSFLVFLITCILRPCLCFFPTSFHLASTVLLPWLHHFHRVFIPQTPDFSYCTQQLSISLSKQCLIFHAEFLMSCLHSVGINTVHVSLTGRHLHTQQSQVFTQPNYYFCQSHYEAFKGFGVGFMWLYIYTSHIYYNDLLLLSFSYNCSICTSFTCFYVSPWWISLHRFQCVFYLPTFLQPPMTFS